VAGTDRQILHMHVAVRQTVCPARQRMEIALIIRRWTRPKYDMITRLYCVIDDVVYDAAERADVSEERRHSPD